MIEGFYNLALGRTPATVLAATVNIATAVLIGLVVAWIWKAATR